ncbi:transcriptional regulator, Spx/MgsR family [Acidovorax sp. CF316]|uniref:arsenate reductase n=1 Tax=Acidovorax sp. CF316 TaxID=1144317 RepID=UPI00026BC3A5|nr:arsenate reductase [Acidovorax sp. CF316]EJE50752.1 transcriptional regulator, Spx/MgsR family [Acidovorax sp. CF316]
MTSQHTITLYGIPNCDTVKKARTWFTDQGLEYRFHDFKKQGVPADRLPGWFSAVGRDRLVNRQGTTWRKLDADTQAAVQDDASASALLQAQPSVVKRPLVEWSQGGTTRISVGFVPETWNEWRQAGSNR